MRVYVCAKMKTFGRKSFNDHHPPIEKIFVTNSHFTRVRLHASDKGIEFMAERGRFNDLIQLYYNRKKLKEKKKK